MRLFPGDLGAGGPGDDHPEIFDLLITDIKVPDFHHLVENDRSRNPAMRFILMQPTRGHVHQLVYLEYVDFVFKPFSMDEIICKIRSAITQVHRHQAEEEIRRLKQEPFRIFL